MLLSRSVRRARNHFPNAANAACRAGSSTCRSARVCPRLARLLAFFAFLGSTVQLCSLFCTAKSEVEFLQCRFYVFYLHADFTTQTKRFSLIAVRVPSFLFCPTWIKGKRKQGKPKKTKSQSQNSPKVCKRVIRTSMEGHRVRGTR